MRNITICNTNSINPIYYILDIEPGLSTCRRTLFECLRHIHVACDKVGLIRVRQDILSLKNGVYILNLNTVLNLSDECSTSYHQ